MQTSRYTNLHNLQIIWASWKKLTFEYFYKKTLNERYQFQMRLTVECSREICGNIILIDYSA